MKGAVGGEFEEQGPAADEGTVGGDDQGPDDGTVSGKIRVLMTER